MTEIQREISPTCIQNRYRNKIIVNKNDKRFYLWKELYICINFFSLNLCEQTQLYTHKSQIPRMCLFIYAIKFTFSVYVYIYTHIEWKSLLWYLWTQLWTEGLAWVHRICKNRAGTDLLETGSTKGTHFDWVEQVKGKAQWDRMQIT